MRSVTVSRVRTSPPQHKREGDNKGNRGKERELTASVVADNMHTHALTHKKKTPQASLHAVTIFSTLALCSAASEGGQCGGIVKEREELVMGGALGHFLPPLLALPSMVIWRAAATRLQLLGDAVSNTKIHEMNAAYRAGGIFTVRFRQFFFLFLFSIPLRFALWDCLSLKYYQTFHLYQFALETSHIQMKISFSTCNAQSLDAGHSYQRPTNFYFK